MRPGVELEKSTEKVQLSLIVEDVMEISHLSDSLGAEVSGVNLANVDAF